MADERGSLLQRHLLLMDALCDPRTSKGDCQVLAVIAGHADKAGDAWPGVNRIAKRAGIHRSTVLAAVGRLQEWGYVDVHRERGRANLYRLSTSSARTTSSGGELVAPTLPPQEGHQSRPRDQTSSADATGLVAPTLPDQSRPRYPNSALNSALTHPKNSVACGAIPSEEERQQEAAKSEGLRAEYLEALVSRPKHARFMESERSIWGYIFDLIPPEFQDSPETRAWMADMLTTGKAR
jgi:DNA-binding MarR family transcriptional regulator